MKFTKMSLVAALLIGSSAFAIDNVKVSGDANVYYDTNDNGTNSLFNGNSSAADVALNLNVTADLAKNDIVSVSAGAGYTVLTTLGLENTLVDNVWGSSHSATAGTGSSYSNALGGARVNNPSWMTEAWVAATVANSTVKVGRMTLDTPLAFTETWSAEKNTFEGAVLINQDIPDTTLVAAYVGNGNGNETFGEDAKSNVDTNASGKTDTTHFGLAAGAVVNKGGQFTTYGTDGAYAAAIINNSFKPLTAQAWYYNVNRLVKAYWLQADLDASSLGVKGLMAGAQYTSAKVDKDFIATHALPDETNSAYALMLGYDMKDVATVKVAYSQVDKKGALAHTGFNTATSSLASKLYTESFWTYGKVTQKDTDTWNVSIAGTVASIDLLAQYTNADQSNTAGNNDLSEFGLSASKSFGPLDTTLAYINTNAKTATVNDDETTQRVQAYLTLNF